MLDRALKELEVVEQHPFQAALGVGDAAYLDFLVPEVPQDVHSHFCCHLRSGHPVPNILEREVFEKSRESMGVFPNHSQIANQHPVEAKQVPQALMSASFQYGSASKVFARKKSLSFLCVQLQN